MAELDVSGLVSTEPAKGTVREDDPMYAVCLTFVPKDPQAFDNVVSRDNMTGSVLVSRDAMLELGDPDSSLYLVGALNGDSLDKLSSPVNDIVRRVHAAEMQATGQVEDGIVPPRVSPFELDSFNYECSNNRGFSCTTEKVLLDEYSGTSGSYIKVSFDRQHASDGSTVDRLKFDGVLHKDQAEALFRGIAESKGLQDF